jgi:hypothetical protein
MDTLTCETDIETRLARYVSAVRSLSEAEQLADLSVFEMAVALGRALERAALGVPSPLSLPQSRHLTLVGSP